MYGDLLHRNRSQPKTLIHYTAGYGLHDVFVGVDPDTVGQYTGMQDFDKQYIFEGDLVNCYTTLYTVCFEEGMWRLKDVHGHWCCLKDMKRDLIVVGNIHDNPGALERGADNE